MPEPKLYGDLIEVSVDKPRARVCIIYTGGTIGMVPEEGASELSPNLRPASLEELMEHLPGLHERLSLKLGMVSLHQPVESSNVSTKHWLAIAATIKEHYDDFDGFVILHGTDTMAYTTSALSFLLYNLAKPVVVTGAQLPITAPRTDGKQNLIAAIEIAAYKSNGLPCIPEVVLCFMDRVLRGNRATKVSASRWQGFDSPNYPHLGSIGEQIRIRQEVLLPAPPADAQFGVHKDLAGDIKVVFFNPAISSEKLDRDFKTVGLDGVILMTYGTGNIQTDPGFTEIIKQATNGEPPEYKRPLSVLNVTQCKEGTVEMGLYAASAGLLEAGVASGLDMTIEAALAKMHWALTLHRGEAARRQLQVNARGEQSSNLFDLTFIPDESSSKLASEVICPADKHLIGRYDPLKLKRAYLRISGLQFEQLDEEQDAYLRVFINYPRATTNTRPDVDNCAQNISVADLTTRGSHFVDITQKSKNLITGVDPVNVSLVGINCRLWCQAIHMSLYTSVM